MKLTLACFMGLTSGTGRIATIDDPLRCAILISGSGSGMEAMLEYFTLRQSPLEFTNEEAQRAVHYVVEAQKKALSQGKKRDNRFHISYADFYGGQLLDPNVDSPEPIIYGGGGKNVNKMFGHLVFGSWNKNRHYLKNNFFHLVLCILTQSFLCY